MPVPVLQFTGLKVFSTSPVTPASCITVVSGAPTDWHWRVTSTPLDLKDATDDNGDFNNTVAIVANPEFFCFLPGDYKFTVQAGNGNELCLPIAVQLHCSRGDCANMRYWTP